MMSDAETRSNFDVICKEVFELDEKIRSARIINGKGKLVAGGMREGLKSLEDAKKDEMLFMELSLRVRMRHEFDEEFGKVEFSLSCHEFDEEFGKVEFSLSYRGKVILTSFPMDDNVLFVSSERQLDLGKIPFSILEIIKKHGG
jgi:hypothetical protein